MRELVLMWRETRMVSYVGITAAFYVVLLIPFKGITVGIVDVGRVGIVIPIIFSFLFGPAAAWGAAIGNLIGDIFGVLNVGSLFGFVANFLIGYIPYRSWEVLTEDKPDMKSPKTIFLFIYLAILVNVIAGVIIGWGLDWLGIIPFAFVSILIVLTNLIWATTLGPFLQGVIYRSVKDSFPLYPDIMEPLEITTERKSMRRIGLIILSLISFGTLFLGVFFGAGFIELSPYLVALLISVLLI